jgi:CheY-like chemotaxis protein
MARILIIDDRPVNRQFLTTLLGYQHHELREASDGLEGLRAARDQRSDLIISDVLMPTMDGYEFVRRLREDADIGKTPVIFSTAHYLSSESRALAKKCGVTSVIFKPCEPQEILDIVAAALGKQPAPEPATPAQEKEFDREHLRLVTDKAVEKADQLRDSHQKLTALIELSIELAEEHNPVQLLDRICSVARRVIGAKWAMVGLLERDRTRVQHLAVAGIALEDSPELRSALLETGVFKSLISEGRTICLSDVTSIPAALQLPDTLPRAASLLVAPLVMRGHVDGWLCLADKLGFDAFWLRLWRARWRWPMPMHVCTAIP